MIGLENIKNDIETLSSMIKDGINSDLTLYTNIKQEKINDKDIILLEIYNAPNKPYYLSDKGLKSNGVYLRIGNTSVPTTDEIIKKMIIDSQNINFEEIVSNKQDLHFGYFGEFLKNNNIEINKNILKNFNMINLDDKYTNLGLLLSDECPYSIKCAIFEGKNDIKFKDRKEFSGCVIKQVNEVTDYLNIYNRISSEIIGLKRVDTRDYPEYALRESILNAVIRRDYNFTGSILISLYDNHIEITSLGGLIKGLNIEDLYSGVSHTRAKQVISNMIKKEIIIPKGKGKNTYYILK